MTTETHTDCKVVEMDRDKVLKVYANFTPPTAADLKRYYPKGVSPTLTRDQALDTRDQLRARAGRPKQTLTSDVVVIVSQVTTETTILR